MNPCSTLPCLAWLPPHSGLGPSGELDFRAVLALPFPGCWALFIPVFVLSARKVTLLSIAQIAWIPKSSWEEQSLGKGRQSQGVMPQPHPRGNVGALHSPPQQGSLGSPPTPQLCAPTSVRNLLRSRDDPWHQRKIVVSLREQQQQPPM